MKVATVRESKVSLEAGHVEDIQLASTKKTGADRRAFQAEMALKYCSGKPFASPFCIEVMRCSMMWFKG